MDKVTANRDYGPAPTYDDDDDYDGDEGYTDAVMEGAGWSGGYTEADYEYEAAQREERDT